MKFSIVTPSFNQGRFIRDCIESVRAQAGVEWEHIVIDACSTDETLSILKEYPHLQWISEKDRGMSDGINKGFLRATGDWMMWLNCDDYLLPGALKTLADFAGAHPEADVVYAGWEFVDGNRKRIKRIKLFPFDLRMNIYYGPYLGSTACFYRKKTVVDEGFLVNVNFHQAMDMEYYAHLGRAGKVFRYCPEIIAGFRLHGDNTSFRHMHETTIDGVLKRQKQIAEGTAVRRCYGMSLKNPFLDAVFAAVLWYYYRVKKVFLKLLHRGY